MVSMNLFMDTIYFWTEIVVAGVLLPKESSEI